MDATAVISMLGLQRHPEGGWYAETWRAPTEPGVRSAGSSIVFLLRDGDLSRWHRLDAPEIWHFHVGAPLELRIHLDGLTMTHVLGSAMTTGERPQVVVPAGAWQTARSLGAWTLVGCTMAPAFTLEGFELAPDGWEPDGR